MLHSIEGVTIGEEIIENAANMTVLTIAKAVPAESLCIAIVEEILERAKRRARTMSMASFQKYLEENKK